MSQPQEAICQTNGANSPDSIAIVQQDTFPKDTLLSQNPTYSETYQESDFFDYTYDYMTFYLSLNNIFWGYGHRVSDINIYIHTANLPDNTGRQLFRDMPNVFVYNTNEAGNQLNVGVRGLNPHRSQELNIRYNNILTNADIFGNASNYYTPPAEAIKTIEYSNGGMSIQSGASFGGKLNYSIKEPDWGRQISYESISTLGSYGLRSTYQRLHGRVGKLGYSVYYQQGASDGYRQGGTSKNNAQFAQLIYLASNRLSIKAELGRTSYLYRSAGQLTDSMFYANSRAVTRRRDYTSPTVYVPSIVVNWVPKKRLNLYFPKTTLRFTTSAVLGSNNTILFNGLANAMDTINSLTGRYNNRRIDIDVFNSYTSELRLIHLYKIKDSEGHQLIAGVSYNNNNLHRRQQGEGTAGTNYDLTLVNDTWGRNLRFRTQNIAAFIENQFVIKDKLRIMPGVRVESRASELTGSIVYLPTKEVSQTINRQFAIGSIVAQYTINKELYLKGNISQVYRPVGLEDITPLSVLERSASHIKDESGYNAELFVEYNSDGDIYMSEGRHNPYKDTKMGKFVYPTAFYVRGTLFQVAKYNKIGSILDSIGSPYILRTNIGNSLTRGVSLSMVCSAVIFKKIPVSVASNASFMDAQYTKATIAGSTSNINIAGNRIEYAPTWLVSNSINLYYKGFDLTILHSYTSSMYADATNTKTASADGTRGIIPAYNLLDVTASYRLNKYLTLACTMNNIFNKQYFIRRATSYPNAGVWSADGRSVQVSLQVSL